MKTLILFYSWSGKTRKLAQELAKKEGADLVEVKDLQRPGTLAAYVKGSFCAIRMKGTPIEPLGTALSAYDKIVVMAPVWAGHPAPAAISALNLLPAGREVEVVMVSASGQSAAKEKASALISSKGCKMTGYRDMKA